MTLCQGHCPMGQIREGYHPECILSIIVVQCFNICSFLYLNW